MEPVQKTTPRFSAGLSVLMGDMQADDVEEERPGPWRFLQDGIFSCTRNDVDENHGRKFG